MAELSEVFAVTKVAFSRSFSLESVQNANEVILSSNSNGFVRFNVSIFCCVIKNNKIRLIQISCGDVHKFFIVDEAITIKPSHLDYCFMTLGS